MAVEPENVDHLQRSLGRRIRGLRSKRGWTQEQFAEFCGVHRTYLGHVERGEKNVSLATLSRVSNALGIRLTSLFGGSYAKLPEASRPTGAAGNRGAKLNVDRLLNELQNQCDGMRQAVHELSRVLRQIIEAPL